MENRMLFFLAKNIFIILPKIQKYRNSEQSFFFDTDIQHYSFKLIFFILVWTGK